MSWTVLSINNCTSQVHFVEQVSPLLSSRVLVTNPRSSNTLQIPLLISDDSVTTRLDGKCGLGSIVVHLSWAKVPSLCSVALATVCTANRVFHKLPWRLFHKFANVVAGSCKSVDLYSDGAPMSFVTQCIRYLGFLTMAARPDHLQHVEQGLLAWSSSGHLM